MTPEQKALAAAIAALLERVEGVDAVWLSGSLGKGEGDAFSDVDVLALTRDGACAEVSAEVVARLSEIAEPALVSLLFGGRILNVVTTDWERFDISFVEARDLHRYDPAALEPLFNRTGQAPAPWPPAAPYQPPAAKIEAMVKEFLRVLGLAAVVLGRQDYVLAISGLELQRRALIDLMIEANRIAPQDRGGALHLRRLLTPEQIGLLEQLPALKAERQAILRANLEITGLYLPLARRLAEEAGAQWPQTLEDATRRRLKLALGLEI